MPVNFLGCLPPPNPWIPRAFGHIEMCPKCPRQLSENHAAIVLPKIECLSDNVGIYDQSATNMTIDAIINTGNCSTAEILVLKNIKFREVENHVLEVHKNKISQKGGTGRNAGYYRTKITVSGVRKDLYSKDYQDIIYKLNEFYTNERAKTVEDIFNVFEESERLSGLDEKTIKEKRCKFNNMKDLWQLNIESITTDDILKWLKGFLQNTPLKDTLKRHLQIINAVFKFAMKKGYCNGNPALFIEAKDYYKFCSPDRKSNEERFFSAEEKQAIVVDKIKETLQKREVI